MKGKIVTEKKFFNIGEVVRRAGSKRHSIVCGEESLGAFNFIVELKPLSKWLLIRKVQIVVIRLMLKLKL